MTGPTSYFDMGLGREREAGRALVCTKDHLHISSTSVDRYAGTSISNAILKSGE